jgi:hypothetical protein
MADRNKSTARTYTEKHRKFCIDLTQTREWGKLTGSARHIFFAMWNSTRTNPAGVYRGSVKSLRYETAINQNRRISEGLKELEGVALVVALPEGDWYLPEWFSENCSKNARSFAQKAVHGVAKKNPSLLERFKSDHRKHLQRLLTPEEIDNPREADAQESSISRNAVKAVTDTESSAISEHEDKEFQRVIQSLKRKIEPRRHKEFDDIISDIVHGRIGDKEALNRLSPFGLAAVEHEELLCSLPDEGLLN